MPETRSSPHVIQTWNLTHFLDLSIFLLRWLTVLQICFVLPAIFAEYINRFFISSRYVSLWAVAVLHVWNSCYFHNYRIIQFFLNRFTPWLYHIVLVNDKKKIIITSNSYRKWLPFTLQIINKINTTVSVKNNFYNCSSVQFFLIDLLLDYIKL